MPDDYCRTVLDAFQAATGRLTVTSLDFAQVQSWQRQGIPLSVVQRGIEQKLKRAAGKWYLRTFPLRWCDDDVQEQQLLWAHAVGPRVVREFKTAILEESTQGNSHDSNELAANSVAVRSGEER